MFLLDQHGDFRTAFDDCLRSLRMEPVDDFKILIPGFISDDSFTQLTAISFLLNALKQTVSTEFSFHAI